MYPAACVFAAQIARGNPAHSPWYVSCATVLQLPQHAISALHYHLLFQMQPKFKARSAGAVKRMISPKDARLYVERVLNAGAACAPRSHTRGIPMLPAHLLSFKYEFAVCRKKVKAENEKKSAKEAIEVRSV